MVVDIRGRERTGAGRLGGSPNGSMTCLTPMYIMCNTYRHTFKVSRELGLGLTLNIMCNCSGLPFNNYYTHSIYFGILCSHVLGGGGFAYF